MKYKIEGVSKDGKRWVQLFNLDAGPYVPIYDALLLAGYKPAGSYPPKKMEFYTMAQTGYEEKRYDRTPCTNPACVGGFLRIENKYRLCSTCGGDATILVGSDKKELDKLLKDVDF